MTNDIEPIALLEQLRRQQQEQLPFVVYRKPNDKRVTAYLQKDASLESPGEFSTDGFVFAPFDDRKGAIFFPEKSCRVYKSPVPSSIEAFSTTALTLEEDTTQKERHINLVKKGIDFLQASEVKKVVLSRVQEVLITLTDPLVIFQKMMAAYPNAMVYYWYHPKVGTWLGATPERLVAIQGHSFTTMALAGTQVYNGSLEVTWGAKEVTEQQYVTDYIEGNLRQLTSEVEVGQRTTVKAGSLLHLCTPIEGQLTASIHLKDLIHTLHPTPAVCGLPKELAKAFILREEGYDRSFYTGFLGEVAPGKKSNVYVNLRCMELKEDGCRIYIGGGITTESIPEKEWEETVAKSKVMLRVLQ